MEYVNAMTVLYTSFCRKPEIGALNASEEFISALPHSHFIIAHLQTVTGNVHFNISQETFMDDPVNGEGRMITDANGITRREGGFQ